MTCGRTFYDGRCEGRPTGKGTVFRPREPSKSENSLIMFVISWVKFDTEPWQAILERRRWLNAGILWNVVVFCKD